MISKLHGVTWLPGKFIETIKQWQEEWFYMADVPSGDKEGVPTFSAAPLKRLHSWTAKNIDWGKKEEVEVLQDRVKFLIDEGVTLVDVIHVMLHRRVQPLQARASPLWRYEPNSEVSVDPKFLQGEGPRRDADILFKPSAKENTFRTRGGRHRLLAEHAQRPRFVFYSIFICGQTFNFLTL